MGRLTSCVSCHHPATKGRLDNSYGKGFEFTAKMDQDYLVVGGHVDEVTQNKIMNSEYVDFGKLLPKDCILTEEDGRLELVIRNGRTYWTPISETVNISNFSKWEQAFRVFSNIYTRKFPHKSGELIQYNHVIHSISSQYSWDNVYGYDKEFRIHLSKHPNRSWAVILQQTWSMKLKDRVSFNKAEGSEGQSYGNQSRQHNGNGGGRKNNGNSSSRKEPCRRYNHGKCNFGTSCIFDHRCAYELCGKFGHNILICHKILADRERQTNKPPVSKEQALHTGRN